MAILWKKYTWTSLLDSSLAIANKVCKLKKSLYGLKQFPRAWFDWISKVLKGYGYTQCQTDSILFVKHSSTSRISILIVYVDNIVLTLFVKHSSTSRISILIVYVDNIVLTRNFAEEWLNSNSLSLRNSRSKT